MARDRSTAYARGASLDAPRALQVADRWHLLANMRQAVERWLPGAHARLRRLSSVAGSALLPARWSRAFPRSASEHEVGAESRARWKAVHDEVRRRRARGETLFGIVRDMDLARATVRKYAAADTFPVRLPHGPGPSLLDPHVDYLLERVGEGCEDAMALRRELRERGYPGTSRHVHRFVADRRTKPTRSGRKPRGETMPMPKTPAVEPSLPSAASRVAAGPADLGVGRCRGRRGGACRAGRDCEGRPHLARRFTALVRASSAGKAAPAGRTALAEFEDWIRKAETCTASAIATFASRLDGDGAAVRAALTDPWSTGQAEGQTNRLKLIKRQSYGRAGLDLLQRRMVLTA